MNTVEMTPAIAEKFAAHIEEVLGGVRPEAIGREFAGAMERGDRAGAVHALAAYYREKPDWGDPDFMAGGYNEKIAENASRGVMREVNVDYTFPDGKIDFLYNPTADRPPLNHEWLWQFSRHSYWVPMARAYAATGEERFTEAFEYQLRTWIAETDLHEGWNGPWSAWRTIECGIRLMGSWQTAFNLFRHSPRFSDEGMLLMLGSMHRQAVHLIAHPTKGNWLMMESNGAYAFGSLYPEFRDASAIRDEAEGRLTRELAVQILPDGFQYELSPDYHLVTYNCAAGLYKIAEATGRVGNLPGDYLDYMKRMALAGVQMMTPGMIQPLTNDCHTMRTAHLARFAEKMFPEIPAFRYVTSGRAEGAPPAGETASRFLPYAGFCAMRSGWDADAAYLCFDVGPLGMAHIHQDKLNINIYKGSDELIFDDGGGQYEISEARKYALSAKDHNTVTVDGLGQTREEPKAVTEPIDAGWITNDRFDYARGSYNDPFGGKRTADQLREVRFCKPDFFCVRDRLTSADGEAHRYELLFHLDTAKVDPVPQIPGAYLSDIGRTYDILVVPLDTAGEDAPYTVSGRTDPDYLGWYIGRNERDQHIATTLCRASLPANDHTFTTLFFPMKRSDPLPEILRGEGGKVTIRFAGKETTLDLDRLDR